MLQWSRLNPDTWTLIQKWSISQFEHLQVNWPNGNPRELRIPPGQQHQHLEVFSNSGRHSHWLEVLLDFSKHLELMAWFQIKAWFLFAKAFAQEVLVEFQELDMPGSGDQTGNECKDGSNILTSLDQLALFVVKHWHWKPI